MPDVIRLLPDHVANQIAAGEVVQRPASVVKELLENAIDADATKIELHVKDAGKTSVQVIDNGKGMSHTDARMAFERHATSKITSADDLFALHTKGFRGEALASIAAIAYVEVKTRPANDDLGSIIQIEGSKVTHQEPTVAPQGTMIKVSNLFFNVPARRKFLKSDNVELRNITDEFHRVAMAHPDVHLIYSHNGSELFNLPAGNLRQRITGIMGARMDVSLVPVDEETELVEISGYIGKPESCRKTRGLQFLFVNNRFIRHTYFNHAVSSAYDGLLRDGVQPTYFLFLKVPTDTVDLNIHPTKTEVKFDDEHSMYAIIRACVKHALGQYSVAPIDFEKEAQYEVGYKKSVSPAINPAIQVDRNFNPFRDEQALPQNPSRGKDFGSRDFSYTMGSMSRENEMASTLIESGSEDGEQADLFGESQKNNQAPFYQLGRKYIVSPMRSGLVMVHQHRAHFRILYERFLKEITIEKGISQQLLFPLYLNLPSAEAGILTQLKEQLESTGFSFGKVVEDQLEITGIPVMVKESEVSGLLEKVFATYRDDMPEDGFIPAQHLAATLSKNMSIRSGDVLIVEEMAELFNKLFACREPELDPESRKIFDQMSLEQLESKFATL